RGDRAPAPARLGPLLPDDRAAQRGRRPEPGGHRARDRARAGPRAPRGARGLALPHRHDRLPRPPPTPEDRAPRDRARRPVAHAGALRRRRRPGGCRHPARRRPLRRGGGAPALAPTAAGRPHPARGPRPAARPRALNGEPAVVVTLPTAGDAVMASIHVETRRGRIVALRVVRDPEKLANLQLIAAEAG